MPCALRSVYLSIAVAPMLAGRLPKLDLATESPALAPAVGAVMTPTPSTAMAAHNDARAIPRERLGRLWSMALVPCDAASRATSGAVAAMSARTCAAPGSRTRLSSKLSRSAKRA
jgi:hypothetical protein